MRKDLPVAATKNNPPTLPCLYPLYQPQPRYLQGSNRQAFGSAQCRHFREQTRVSILTSHYDVSLTKLAFGKAIGPLVTHAELEFS
jgi:hypothetical protein